MKNEKEVNSGNKSELTFKKLFLTSIKATKEQDMKDHWDIMVNLDNKAVKIDVKSIKKENRNDILPNENYHWVEITNVNGDTGWLYGDSDLIAFEVEDYFVLVGTLKLRKFLERKMGYISSEIENIEVVHNKSPYSFYQRKGRKDIVVRVKTIDLIYISYLMIKK